MSQPAAQAPASQFAAQPTPQVPQVVVPLAEFSQYERFLIDQATTFSDFTKQQLEFIKQQSAKNSEEATAITGFLKQETGEFKTFVEQAVGVIVVVASVIAGVMAFFGIRRWKDLINEQKVLVENLMIQQRQAAETLISEQRQTIEKLLDSHNTVMRKLIDDHDDAIARSLAEHSGAVTKVMEESDKNQQKWFKQTATEMSEEQFNDVIGRMKILWSDETHDKYNNWLIKLIKSSGAELDAVKKADATENLKSGKQYDIIISDGMDLFDEFSGKTAKKIINTGEEGFKKYKDIAKEHGVDAVVNTDASLLRTIVSGH